MNSHTANIDQIYGVIPNAFYLDYNDPNTYYCFFEAKECQGKYGPLCKTKVVKFLKNNMIFFGIAQLPIGLYPGCFVEISLDILSVNNNYLIDSGTELNVFKAYISRKLDMLENK